MKIKDWREVLDIIAKHSPKGEDAAFIFEADHDIIWTHLDIHTVPKDSVDGRRLLKLGLHFDESADVYAVNV